MKNSKCRYLSTLSPSSFLLSALVLFGFFSANVNADYWTWSALGSTGHLSPSAACSATVSYGDYPSFKDVVVVPPPSDSNCQIERTAAAGGGFFTWSLPPSLVTGSCPSGTVASSPDGYSVCEPPPPNPCTAKTGKSAIPSGQIAYGENAAGISPTTARMCDADLCVIRINHGTTIPIGGGLQANYITNGVFTGEQATGPNNCPVTVTAPTPKDPDLPKPIDTVTPAADTPDGVPVLPTDCPAGSAFGSVNGVNVCSPSGSQIAYQPSTTTQTNNGTTTESTTQKSDTVNDDGSVTTKTTTTSNSGGATSTTTTSGTNGRDGLNGKDGKGIDSIDLGVAPSAESGEVADPFPAPGSGVDGEGGSQKEFGVTAHFAGGGSCLADKTVTTPLGTWTIPLSQLCPWFDIMYKIISLVAVFAALRILVMA